MALPTGLHFRHAGPIPAAPVAPCDRIFEDNRAAMMVARASDGALVAVNAAAARLYGLPRAALLALRATDLDDGAPGAWPRLRAALERGARPMVFGHRMPDGEVRRVEVTATPIEHAGEPCLLGVLFDVTDRERAEAGLRELNDELERRVKEEVARNLAVERTLFHQARLAAMGEMLGAIAHQWRQPLNALALLLGNVDDARRHRQIDDDYLARAVADGNRLVQKMASTINDFRDFARPDKARTRFALRPQIEDTLRLLEAGLRHHCIATSVEGEEELEALGLPNEYSQVLLNLVGNARDAIVARGGGGGRIAIVVRREAGEARVSVTDDGGGIAVEPIERVFEPYFTTKPGGTGLGLYLSRMILQKSMGGTLHARRIPGGSELTMSTPLP